MLTAADILEAEKEAFGRLMVTEMGKPLKAAIEEAAKCALGCRYYAENAERFLADEAVETSATQQLRRLPAARSGARRHAVELSVLAGLPLRRAGAHGRATSGLLKHASNVPQCALAIEEIFRRAGFPEGCFQTLLIGSDQVKRGHRGSRGSRR